MQVHRGKIREDMKEQEKQTLKKKYEQMPDGELIERLAEGRDQYTEVAYELLSEEVKKRGIEDQINKPKDSQIEAEISDIKEVERDYRFYCVSITIVLVILFVQIAIPNFVAAYRHVHQLSDYESSPLLSILWIIGGIVGVIFLFTLGRMGGHLKSHNMTKLKPWVWVVGAFVPVVSLIIILRIFILTRRLLKKMQADGRK